MPFPTSPGIITSVDVQIYETNTYYYTYSQRVCVAAHELGHALGLGHYSGEYLMEPADSTRFNYGIYSPQADDVNGVLDLY